MADNVYLQCSIHDTLNEASDGIGDDVAIVGHELLHVFAEVDVAVRRAVGHLETEELDESEIVLFVEINVDEQHLTTEKRN